MRFRVQKLIRDRLPAIMRAQGLKVFDRRLNDAEFVAEGEAIEHPHNKARDTFIEIDGMAQPAPAPRFSRTSAAKPQAGVEPGVDVHAAMDGWGFAREEIEALVSQGALR